MPRLDFDVSARDHASDTLRRIGGAFRGLARDADESGRDSGRGFGGGLRRWFHSEGRGIFRALGHAVGDHFGASLVDAFSKPGYGLQLAGVLVGLAGIIGPGVGSVLGGAVVAGFGTGLAALGIVFAAKSEEVKQVWHDTLEGMASDMQVLSRPFESALIEMAGIASRTFNAFKPALESSFKQLAPVTARFVDQTGLALEQLIPMIGPVTDAFERVLDALGPGLNTALSEIAAGMTELSESVEKNPAALADLVAGVGALTRDGLGLVTTLNEINGEFERLTGGMSAVDATIGLLRAPILAVNAAFSGQELILKGLHTALEATTFSSDASGHSMNLAADRVTKAAQAYAKTSGAADSTVGPLGEVSDALTRQKQQFSAAITAMGQWSTKALGASNAAIAYEQALDDATASLRQNGRTLDISSEKGRANRTALNNLAEAANRQAQAMDEAGASNQAVARKAAQSRDAFERLAVKMGYSKSQAKALADQLIRIPNVSRTVTITRRNITYNDIITRRSTGNFEGGINAQPRASGGGFQAHQLLRVGEQGEELVQFDRPGRVIPNHALRNGSGGGDVPKVELRISSAGSRLDDVLLDMLKKSIRVRGGDVQLVLGS